MNTKEVLSKIKEIGNLDDYTIKSGAKGNALYTKASKSKIVKKVIGLGYRSDMFFIKICSNPYGIINFKQFDELLFKSNYNNYKGYSPNEFIEHWFMLHSHQINNFDILIDKMEQNADLEVNNFLREKTSLMNDFLFPTMSKLNSLEDFYEYFEHLKFRDLQAVCGAYLGQSNEAGQWHRLFIKAYVKAPDFYNHLAYYKNESIRIYTDFIKDKEALNQKLFYIEKMAEDIVNIYNDNSYALKEVNYYVGEYNILPVDEIAELEAKIIKSNYEINKYKTENIPLFIKKNNLEIVKNLEEKILRLELEIIRYNNKIQEIKKGL
jgi:hypothetical protein